MNNIQLLETIVKDEATLPDRYEFNTLRLEVPDDNFVISRTKDGKILSVFGDNSWDLNPYKSNPSQYAKFEFKVLNSQHNYIKESKKLLFALMLFGSGKRGSTYSVATLKELFTGAILPLAKYAENINQGLFSVLENNLILRGYVQGINDKSNQFSSLNRLLVFLHGIDNGILDIDYSEDKELILEIKNYLHKRRDNYNQTYVIPSRILAESLKQRWMQIVEIENNLSALVKFMSHFLRSECFAIASSNYRKFNCHKKSGSSTWNEAVEKYGLESIFQKYDVMRRGIFPGFIKKIQGTCKHLIHAYTGMRNGEILNLRQNCISKVDNEKVVRIISTTTKMAGGLDEVEWVTTKEIEKIIHILVSINDVVFKHYEIEDENPPLFIMTSFVASTKKRMGKKNIAAGSFYDIDQLPLNNEKLIINKEDMRELENIDFRIDFSDHNFIGIGKVWKFKSHQYRRSLAVYAIQSGLVSLGALQIQFKHLFKEMLMYYGNGTSRSKDILKLKENHIVNDMEKIKPEIDAISFIENVVFSDEQLFGAGGIFVKRNLNTELVDMKNYMLENREKTIKQFNNGEIAYAEHALGACLSTVECNKHITGSLLTCFGCESAVIMPNKLETSIKKQKDFLTCLDENSIEYRSELWELKQLEQERKKILGNET